MRRRSEVFVLTTLPRTHKNLVSSCLFSSNTELTTELNLFLVAFDKLRLCSHRLVYKIALVAVTATPTTHPSWSKDFIGSGDMYYYSITRCVDISNLSSAEPLFLRRTPSHICLPCLWGNKNKVSIARKQPYVADVAISRKRHYK